MGAAVVGCEARSYAQIRISDLEWLADAAYKDIQNFAHRNPRHGTLPERIVAIVLAQGAAQHFVDGVNGVKDFDVWSFFEHADGSPVFPPRRIGHGFYDEPRFQDCSRRVDFMGRTLRDTGAVATLQALRNYLIEARSRSAFELSKRAVIGLYPRTILAEVIWPA